MKTILEVLEEINQIGYEECDNVEETGISVQGLGKIEKLLEDWSHDIIEICAGQLVDDGAIQEGWLYNRILKVKDIL